jgi:hypothetical protein
MELQHARVCTYVRNVWLQPSFVSDCKQPKYVIANMQPGKKKLHLVSMCNCKQRKKDVGAPWLKKKRDRGLNLHKKQIARLGMRQLQT